MNASEVARRAQARAVYADALVNQKNLDKDCLNAVAAGPSAAASYSAMKTTDQRLGAVFTTPLQQASILTRSPCAVPPPPPPPIVYPNYELVCSDPLGIQIMATGTFTSFTFTTTSLGAGVIDFQFFLNNVFQSNQLNVLGVDSNLITPPSGINQVRYVFKCTPILIEISCEEESNVLQWTQPFSFKNITRSSVTLTLYKHPISGGIIETYSVADGEIFTPSPSWGWDYWSIGCPQVASLTFESYDYNTGMAFSGQVLSQGDAPVTEWGAVWNTTGNPTIEDHKVSVDPSGNPLDVFTVYYFAGMPTMNYARAYATNSIGTSYGFDLSAEPQICLAKGTMITLVDYNEKPIEDIQYEDDILIWNFDNACFGSAKPLWIKKAEKTVRYNLLEFSDGSKLKTINQHRIFNKQAGKFTYPMTDETPLGTITWNSKGNEIYLISKRTIIETTEFYNIITEYHMNLFSNGILTSCRYNNIYVIMGMKFQKVERETVPAELYSSLPMKYYKGLRLSEQIIPVGDTLKYIERLERKKK